MKLAKYAGLVKPANGRGFGWLLVVVALFVLVSLPARAQVYPAYTGYATNFPNWFTNATASQAYVVGITNSYTNTWTLNANSGLGVEEVFQGSNLMTGPVTTWFYPSVDGSNYFTLPWATLVIPATGTNTVIGGTNWSHLQLRGYLSMSVVVSNGTGAAVYGFGPSDLLTNITPLTTNYTRGGLNWTKPSPASPY
jgi:hypothetical protein